MLLVGCATDNTPQQYYHVVGKPTAVGVVTWEVNGNRLASHGNEIVLPLSYAGVIVKAWLVNGTNNSLTNQITLK